MAIVKVGDSDYVSLESVKSINFTKKATTRTGRRCAEVTFTDGTVKEFEECPKSTEDALSFNSLRAE